MTLLDIDGLSVAVVRPGGGSPRRRLVDDVSFTVQPAESVALVGESGSGKTLTALALSGLLPAGVEVVGGRAVLDGAGDLLRLDRRRLARVRGARVGLVFQEPMTALNPAFTVGRQVAEAVRLHGDPAARSVDAREETVRLLERVRLARARERLSSYPHQLSGGERQRVVLAVALAGRPDLLLADEPTTALDVTTQAAILALLAELQAELGLALVLITHDLAVVAETCRRALVMAGGQIVERGTVDDLFARPAHPVTRGLVSTIPRLDDPPRQPPPVAEPGGAPLLSAHGLTKRYSLPGGFFRLRRRRRRRSEDVVTAARNMSLEVRSGECVAVVGESGSGKTTLGRMIVRLLPPDGGEIAFAGDDLLALDGETLRRHRRRFQMVFQDPLDSLTPHLRVGSLVEEALAVHGLGGDRAGRRRRTAELLELVGLDPALAERYPHQLSGGERQRVGIARALAPEPDLVVADEPVSALDMSVRTQVVELLARLQREMGLALVFIAHDLGLVRQIAHRVVVCHRGVIVEEGPVGELFARPRHEVTRALLAAIPRPPERPEPDGRVPEPDARPTDPASDRNSI